MTSPTDVDIDEVLEDEISPEPTTRRIQRQPRTATEGAPNLIQWQVGGVVGWVWQQVQRYPRYLIIGGGSFLVLLLYLSQAKGPEADKQIPNANDARSLQAFKESEEIKKSMEEIDTEQEILNDALDQERQRAVIKLAQGFRSIATFYMANPNHVCRDKSEVECLRSFLPNRSQKLEEISDGRAFGRNASADPRQMIDPITWTSSEVERTTAIRLAMVLAKPIETRRKWEQNWINRQFPLLNMELPVEELSPRPGLLARQLKRVDGMQASLLQGSQENYYKLERQQAQAQQR
ncbi:MAG TPA: hypothetical protein V6D18_15370 [Thermosynechococcaceae cyanobacterium]